MIEQLLAFLAALPRCAACCEPFDSDAWEQRHTPDLEDVHGDCCHCELYALDLDVQRAATGFLEWGRHCG